MWDVNQRTFRLPDHEDRLETVVSHSVSLFTRGKSPKFPTTSNPRQNCFIGQHSADLKKVFFFAGSVWTPEKTQGEVGGDQEPPGDT